MVWTNKEPRQPILGQNTNYAKFEGFLETSDRTRDVASQCDKKRTKANECERMRTSANKCEQMRTNASGQNARKCERVRINANECENNARAELASKKVMKGEWKWLKNVTRVDSPRNSRGLVYKFGKDRRSSVRHRDRRYEVEVCSVFKSKCY